MAMYYYARKLQKSARKAKTTPQQTPIRTNTNGSIVGCGQPNSTISSTVMVSGPGAGVGCNSQLNASSLSPGSSDSGQLQQLQTQQQLQQLRLSIQSLGLGPSSNSPETNNGSVGATSSPQAQQNAQSSKSPPPSISPVTNNQLLQKEWEKVGLVFRDSNLVSGTLDALIHYLVPTPSYYPDRAFIFAFLLSSRLHIRPHELLGTVFRRAFAKRRDLEVAPEAHQGQVSSSPSNYTGEDSPLKTVSHMVQLLGEWAELFPYDFRDDKMMGHVRAITQKCVSIDPKVRKDVSLLLTSLLARLTSLERYEAFLHKVAVETQPEDQALSTPSILAICPDPNLLAEQLTHIELERLSHIGPEEFVQAFVKGIEGTSSPSPSTINNGSAINPNSSPLPNGGNDGGGGDGIHNGSISGSTGSSNSYGETLPGVGQGGTASTTGSSSSSKESRKTRNLENYVKWFNRLCYIIASDVCKAKKKKLRVRYVEYWVEVAKVCFNIGNFNSLMAIITGLNMMPVLRMKKTWGKVNCELLSSLEQHMDPSSNFTAYRSLLKSVAWHASNPSCGGDSRGKTVIPFFSLLIKDLYFLHQGCTSRLPNGHINFEKCWQLAKQVTQLMTWQQVQCPFPKVPTIISSIQSIPVLGENGLLLASFECESPETADEKDRLKQLNEEASFLLRISNEAHQNLTMSSTSSAGGGNNMTMMMPTSLSPCSPSTSSASQYPFYLQQPYSSEFNFHPSQFLEQGQTEAHIELEIPMGVPPPPPLSSASSAIDENGDEEGRESVQLSSPS